MHRSYDDDGCLTLFFKIGFLAALFLGVFIGIYNFLDNNKDYIATNHITLFYISVFVITIIFFIVLFKQKRKYETKIEGLKKDYNSKEKELKQSHINLQFNEKEIEKLKECVYEKDRLYESYKTLEIHNISTLYSDFLTLEYYLSAEWLENKNILLKHNPGFFKRVKGGRPAKVAAEKVKQYGAKTRFHVEEYKIMLYKYEALLSLFPELNNYVDDIETIKLLSSYDNIDTFQQEYDRVIDYIPREEYEKLSRTERNQLALDKYIRGGKKTNWQIGRDYEMYCAYRYEKDGWSVERFGIERGLNDMGRDLIATKGGTVHIIQCKLWSQHKLIHEKHIAQLYGSTIEYSISHERDLFTNEIVPVFITNIDLSDTAKKFAERLGIKVYKWDMKEFPRIKCNVNNGEKIYHLPFDQQYDRTKIIHDDESYELTVKDAEKKEFRRAKRFYFTNNIN